MVINVKLLREMLGNMPDDALIVVESSDAYGPNMIAVAEKLRLSEKYIDEFGNAWDKPGPGREAKQTVYITAGY